MNYYKNKPISILALLFFMLMQVTNQNVISQDINKGMKYFQAKQYKKAAKEFEKAIPDIEKEFGKKDTVIYSKLLLFTAKSYNHINKKIKAKKYFSDCINLYKKLNSVQNLSYAESCHFLGNIYKNTGNYNKAEQYLNNAISIRGTLLGKENPYYASSCSSLGLLYVNLGNYKKAEPLLIATKNAYLKFFGKNNFSYGIANMYLGLLYINKADATQNINKRLFFLHKAEELSLKAKIIIENTLGKQNKTYSTIISNLASIYLNIGKNLSNNEEKKVAFKKAIKHYNEIGLLLRKNEILYITNHTGLGLIYKDMTKLSNTNSEKKELFKKAESYLKEAKQLIKQNYGKKHPYYLASCTNLAGLYTTNGNLPKIEHEYLEANQLLNYHLKQSAKFMSEKERENYLNNKIAYKFELLNSFFLSAEVNKEKNAAIVYNNALNLKGQLLKSSISTRKTILQSGDTAIIDIYNEMNNISKILEKQHSLSISNRRSDIKELEEKVNVLEKKLIQQSQHLSVSIDLTATEINWQSIQKSLKKDETAIEFIQFRYKNIEGWTNNILYYALILRKEYKYPKAIFLFEEKQLQKLLEREEYENDFNYVKRLYSPSSAQSDSLYNLTFKPIQSYLKTTKTLYISPTGLLNRIAFDAIPISKDTTKNLLSDKFNVYYLSSTASNINKTGLYKKDIKNIALFGGIEYSLTSDEMEKLASNSKREASESKTYSIPQGINTRNVSWSYLPGSLKETEEIKNTLKNNKVEVNLYSKEKGSEEQFKALENDAPSILHVSTHGFYFGDDKKSKEYKEMIDDKVKFAHSKNPLLRSGFILAGGNLAFQGKEIPDGIEDGVLTAAEISRLNFFNTKLAVLSACQTGLGDVKGSEGVYGLQRAFKMAGVEYLLFSLWEVPDYQTKELMTNFYKNWFSGMEIREAFKKAQNQLKTKYAKVEGAAFAWAAFVLMK